MWGNKLLGTYFWCFYKIIKYFFENFLLGSKSLELATNFYNLFSLCTSWSNSHWMWKYILPFLFTSALDLTLEIYFPIINKILNIIRTEIKTFLNNNFSFTMENIIVRVIHFLYALFVSALMFFGNWFTFQRAFSRKLSYFLVFGNDFENEFENVFWYLVCNFLKIFLV